MSGNMIERMIHMSISGTYYIKKWLPHPSRFGASTPEPPAPSEKAESVPEEQSAPNIKLRDYGTPGEGFFEGEMTFVFEPQEDGTLLGTAGGDPIVSGYYTGDEFFTVDYYAGPGRWHVWARVDSEGFIEGIICMGECMGQKGGYPNLVYGKKID